MSISDVEKKPVAKRRSIALHKDKEKNLRRVITITSEQWEWLETFGLAQGLTRSSVLRVAIEAMQISPQSTAAILKKYSEGNDEA